MDVVTGASSYTGRYIAGELLDRGRPVRSLARTHDDHLFSGAVEWHPLDFTNPARLVASLKDVDTLYNTYWIRFPRGRITFENAVENTKALIDAARAAGIRRLVHISVSNAESSSELPYFRGKAATENLVRTSGIPYAIVRPTLVFGREDILIHNMAWLLRHFPIYLVPGTGSYRTRPVYVGDVARMAVDAGAGIRNFVMDAAGPDVLTYTELVKTIRSAVGSRTRIMHVAPRVALSAAWALGFLVHDVIVTPEEVRGLMQEVVMSAHESMGATRFGDWLHENAHLLGQTYVSELKRHWAPRTT